MMLANGAGTAKYSIGKYHIKEYGNCHLYINKNNPPYIVVKLPDTFVIFNGKTEGDTKAYFEKLMK
ncbi:MAG: hypothetical protein ACOZCL_00120 [Bacillota bacterium]